MPPTLTSDASTSTMNWQSGSGTWRMEADVNRGLRVWKSSSADGVQLKDTLEDVRAVRGVAMVL